MRTRSWVVGASVAALVAVAGCKDEKGAPSLDQLKPQPLPSVAEPPSAPSLSAFEVEAAPVYGDALPSDAVQLRLVGEKAFVGSDPFDRSKLPAGKPVLLIPDADTWLVQAAPVLAALDDAHAETWLLHPEGKVAFKLVLRDEPAFRSWLDEVAPGKVRLIHRADGYELQTAVGKLPGADPNGPSVPLRGGHWDVARLRASLAALKHRFPQAKDSCVVPSFGMELQSTAKALSAYYAEPGQRVFDELCLVYPRP